MISQEFTVNSTYQCLVAMSMQHVPVIIFTYLFINMYVISTSLRLLEVAHTLDSLSNTYHLNERCTDALCSMCYTLSL